MKMPKLSLYSKWRLVFVVAVFFASSAMLPLSGLFTRTANAAPTAAECYALDGLPYNKNLVAGPLNPNREKQEQCIDAGYCQEGAGNLATGIICTEDVYKASDQYKTTQANNDADTILNSQIAPLITVVCGSPSTNTQADAEYADCASKVKTQYKVCHDAALNHSEDVASSVSTCMNSWTQATYPSKKIKKDAITSAVGDGVVKGTEKATEISKEAQEKAETDCEAKGATYDPDSEDADDDGCVAPVDNGAVCTGGTMGWILCPIATLFQDMIKMIAGLIGNIMEIDPVAGNTDLQRVWRIFVGFANLLLVVGFLVVIFSQATSVGLSAYGIKKMLPRIIAAAILINVSYFICSIALDFANIAGASIRGIMQAVPVDVETDTTNFTAGATWASNITALVLGGIGIYMLVTGWVAFIVPLLIVGGLAIIAIFLIIALRQVLVILLIVVAPIAFAAMILPNTEQLFTKWRKLFVNMLVLYPVVMFLLYGSGLVGQIILVANNGQGDDTSAMMSQMVAFVVMTIGPFAGLFMYLKSSNKLMGMATGMVNKLGSGAQGWGKNWASQKQKNSKSSQARANRQASVNEAAARRAYSNFKRDPSRYTRFMGRDAQQIMNARVTSANEKIETEAVNQSTKSLPYYNPTAYDGGKDGKGPNDRRRMASDAYAAIKAGDMIKAHAIASTAARAGADEFTDFHTFLQESMTADSDGKWTPERTEQMKEVNRRVLTNFGSDLRPKNMGLVSALERSFDTDEQGNPVGGVYIKDEMKSQGMQQYYKAMGAEQISVFSSNAAREAAGSVTDEALRDVIENANIRGRMKKGTREAYEIEYAKRVTSGQIENPSYKPTVQKVPTDDGTQAAPTTMDDGTDVNITPPTATPDDFSI